MTKLMHIKPKNWQQQEAIEALLNPDIDMVVLHGVAGSGKTLLALAAGLTQCIDTAIYKDIIFTRAMISIGKDIGFLPGTEQDKLLPWCGAMIDNLEIILPKASKRVSKETVESLMANKIKVLATTFMRGRSFTERWVIVDEVQNLTSQELKVLVTRVGEGTKLVLLGDSSQIDNLKLDAQTNALADVIYSAQEWPIDYIKVIDLPTGERSRLATWAVESL
jgi:PhoH-like ATPase